MVLMSLIDNIYLLLTGVGLGLLISAPVGPVNILCIQHSLARGFWSGFVTGCGAIVGDVMIASMAALGLTAISGLMETYEIIIQGVGGLILLGFGVRLLLSHPRMLPPDDRSLHPFKNLGAAPQSFLLTVTNPGALLGIFAVIGSAGTAVGGLQTYMEALALLGGLFIGAVLWWAGLARLISLFRSQMTERRLTFINQSAGLLLIGFGLVLVVKSLFFS